MKKSIHSVLFISIIWVTASFWSCSSKNDSSSNSIEVAGGRADTDPIDYIHGDKHLTPQQLDSLATYEADYLSPGQGVGVLSYYAEAIEKASGRAKTEKMVAFKDLYNILASNHGNDFQTAVRKLQSQQNIDIKAVYDNIVTRLDGSDDESGSVSVADSRTDTIPADTIAVAATNPEADLQ